MKCFCAAVTLLLVSLSGIAHAQCTTPTLNSFTLTPNAIAGDQSQFAVGTVSFCLPPGDANLAVIQISESYITSTRSECINGYATDLGTCNYPNAGTGNITVEFYLNGYNYTTTAQSGTVNVNLYSYLPVISDPLTVNPAGVPPQDPGPCPGQGVTGSGCVGKPINVTTGNTWIAHHDYSIPGLGGGLSLTRTWTSFWPNISPPAESGIFGDSWRSSFEEFIQLTSGGATYWKGDSSQLIYSYSGTYSIISPLNDQTTLAANPTTGGWIITQKNGTQRNFNSGGYLTSIVDLNGNTTTINLDATYPSRIDSVTSAGNQTLTFNYTNSEFPTLCTSIVDSVGTAATYTYNSSGLITGVKYPDDSEYNFAYQPSTTLIQTVTDSMGKTIEYHSYDSLRRGLTSQQANDSNGNPVNKVTISYGSPQPYQNYVCDSTGEDCVTVQVSARAQRSFISQTYGGTGAHGCNTCDFLGNGGATADALGNRTSATDSNGNTTLYTYDNYSNMISKALPDYFTGTWDTWYYTYNSLGEVLTATDPLGTGPGDPNHTTINYYDPSGNGNLLSVTTPSPDGGITPPSTTHYTYYPNGTLKTVTDPLGNQTSMTYYPTGLLYTVTDAAQNTTTYAYDGRGNLTLLTDATQNQTQFQYDSMNRLTEIIYQNTTSSTVIYAYDWRGRRISVTDQDGRVTKYGYDDADRLISVTDAQSPNPGVTTYGYDDENNLTDIWDANHNHTQFTYLPGKYLQKTVFPSGYSESYAWDGNFNLTSKTDRNNTTINYEYDYQNHLYIKQDPGEIVYDYDPAGRLTQVNDYNTASEATYGFVYDNMNRLSSATTTYQFALLPAQTVQYGYDAASNRKLMIDPTGTQTNYTYDQLNRLYTLGNSWAGSFTFNYDSLSRRTQLIRPNGVTTAYAYDALSHLLSVLHQVGATTIDGHTYTYDPAGNRTSKLDINSTITQMKSAYSYDNIYQLTRVMMSSQTSSGSQQPYATETYTYDLVGNRLSSLGVSHYTYNSSNELLSTPSGKYGYDKDGEMLTRPDGKQFKWDYENRMTQAILPGSGGTVTFTYDPFGRRIQKSGPLGTANYIYDGKNILETLDQNANPLARYSDTLSVDEPLAELVSGSTSYYEQDGLGSVTSLSGSSGAITNSYIYNSFGSLTGSSGTTPNPFQYTSRELDPETGIYYYRARYYDPNVGRFLSNDEIGNDEGTNLYLYVGNSPIDLRDPTGFYKLIGFLPDQQTQMANAIEEAIQKLSENCPSCAGPDGPKIINALQSATFSYAPDLKDCAQTWPFHKLLHRIEVGGLAFSPQRCCSLASTLAHEGYHLAGAGDPEAYKLEKDCFNCGTGHPPSK